QSTALNALAFLYREIIKQPLSLDLRFVKSARQETCGVRFVENRNQTRN
ncbi:MAG: hypothetical protein ACI8O8_003220, partial [Oleiphilaceae bacterium]